MKLFKLPFFAEKKILDFLGAVHTIVDMQVKDKLGRVIEKRKFIGKSLTANFLQKLYADFNYITTSADFPASGAPFTTSHDLFSTANVDTVMTTTNGAMTMNSGVGGLSSGIICGTGITAPTPTDHVIETLIANGNGAGQLQYQQNTSLSGVQIVGANSSLVMSRIAINNSGASIVVSEVALYALSANQAFTYLFYRDLVSPAVTVLNTQTLTVQITFQITT